MADKTPDPLDAVLDSWTKGFSPSDLMAVSLSMHMSRMVQIFEHEAQELVRPYGFGFGELDVLFALMGSGKPYELRPRELVRSCLVTGGAITGRVDRLVRQGLVDRNNSLRDRREMVIRLTPAGLKIARSMRLKVTTTSSLTAALKDIDQPRRAELLRLVVQLYDRMNELVALHRNDPGLAALRKVV